MILKKNNVGDDSIKDTVEEKERVVPTKQEKRRAQKLKKQAARVRVPKTGDDIIFKEKDTDSWKSGRVVGSWKKNSKYQYWKHLLLSSGLTVERDVENGIEDWKVENEVEADNESVDDDAVIILTMKHSQFK